MLFDDPSLGLRKAGKLRNLKSSEIKDSGVSVGLECLDRDLFDFDRAYPRLIETGAKHARIQTGWNLCEKTKGVYTFEWLDHIVDTLLAGGVRPWFNLGFGNPLYMSDISTPTAVGCVPLYYGDEALTAWKNFVSALAGHYNGRIRHWEIWNEPDCSQFWYPHGNCAKDYARLIELTAPLIRSEISDAQIGGCAATYRNDRDWVRELIATGVGRELDFYAIHQYQIIPEKQWDIMIAGWKRAFAKHGNPAIEIWQGESGFASWFPENHWMGTYLRLGEENQAKMLLRRYVCDFGSGIARSSFFQMVDLGAKLYQMARLSQKSPARHGLVDAYDYKPKMSHAALSHITPVFDCDTVAVPYFCFPETGEIIPKKAQVSKLLETALYIRTFERNGWPLYVYYIPEDVQLGIGGHNNLELDVIAGEAPNRLEQPILVNLLTGLVYDVEKTENPNIYRKLPLTDYPLLLTDRRALSGRIEYDV